MSIVVIVAAERSIRSLRQESQQCCILSAAPPRMVRYRKVLCSRLEMAISTAPPPQVERRTRAPYSSWHSARIERFVHRPHGGSRPNVCAHSCQTRRGLPKSGLYLNENGGESNCDSPNLNSGRWS